MGKELVARALHREGARRTRPFCAVNCAALTDELFEAEFFGHSRGAFTGAVSDRVGLAEEAHRGMLFLDEVGELSARAQARLLRVVQDGELRRVGENVVRRVDVHLVTATNRTLTTEVAAGRFRQDLLFRLAVVRLKVPPLRVRGEDIGLLARYFWTRALARTGGACHAELGDCASVHALRLAGQRTGVAERRCCAGSVGATAGVGRPRVATGGDTRPVGRSRHDVG